MGRDDREDGAFGQSMPARLPGTMPVPAQVLAPVSLADIYQAAVRRAMHEYELDRLFNPEYYDYQI